MVRRENVHYEWGKEKWCVCLSYKMNKFWNGKRDSFSFAQREREREMEMRHI